MEFAISAACIWEIATKARLGKWPAARGVTLNLKRPLATSAYRPLSITIEHAQAAASFNWQHRDPYDRILAAQSQIESIPLVTADPAFRRFGIPVMWLSAR